MIRTLSAMLGPLLTLLFFTTGPALAQAAGGCELREVQDPPGVIYQCAGGLVIEAEAGTMLEETARDCDGAVPGWTLDSGAIRVSLPPESGPFQITTPHAIASVRGTVFVVDVQAGQTAVLVLRGAVAVSRDDGTDMVELGAGEGVTIAADTPVTVRTWPEDKVAALLARFGK